MNPLSLVRISFLVSAEDYIAKISLLWCWYWQLFKKKGLGSLKDHSLGLPTIDLTLFTLSIIFFFYFFTQLTKYISLKGAIHIEVIILREPLDTSSLNPSFLVLLGAQRKAFWCIYLIWFITFFAYQRLGDHF